MRITSVIICAVVSIFGVHAAAVYGQNNVEWIEIQDPRSGRITPALFCHPRPGTKLPAVIYNHGKIIENIGYQAARQKDYDVAEFVMALADNQYAAIAPIRPANTDFFFAPINRAVMSYLKQRSDIDM